MPIPATPASGDRGSVHYVLSGRSPARQEAHEAPYVHEVDGRVRLALSLRLHLVPTLQLVTAAGIASDEMQINLLTLDISAYSEHASHRPSPIVSLAGMDGDPALMSDWARGHFPIHFENIRLADHWSRVLFQTRVVH
jgi:hypothetical protein